MPESEAQILALVSQIVTAHVSHNAVQAETVPDLIRRVYNALADLRGDTLVSAPRHQRETATFEDYASDLDHQHVYFTPGNTPPTYHAPEFHVHPKHGQTVFSDQLMCMECGVRMKMLKRHLQTVHRLTPREYRAKWALPPDYPMVAADYAKLRSSLALESGLGLKPEARAERVGRTSRQTGMR